MTRFYLQERRKGCCSNRNETWIMRSSNVPKVRPKKRFFPLVLPWWYVVAIVIRLFLREEQTGWERTHDGQIDDGKFYLGSAYSKKRPLTVSASFGVSRAKIKSQEKAKNLSQMGRQTICLRSSEVTSSSASHLWDTKNRNLKGFGSGFLMCNQGRKASLDSLLHGEGNFFVRNHFL